MEFQERPSKRARIPAVGLLDLDDSLLLAILARVRLDPANLLASARVCRRLRALIDGDAQRLFQTLVIGPEQGFCRGFSGGAHPGELAFVPRFFERRGGHVRKLVLHTRGFDSFAGDTEWLRGWLFAALHNVPRLTHFELHGASCMSLCVSLSVASPGLSAIHLRPRGGQLAHIQALASVRGLRRLVIDLEAGGHQNWGHHRLPGGSRATSLGGLSALTQLTCLHVNSESDTAAAAALHAGNHTSLRSLSLTLGSSAGSFPLPGASLTDLRLRLLGHATPSSLARCTALRALSLERAPLDSTRDVVATGGYCPYLELPADLSALTGLRTLTLRNVHSVRITAPRLGGDSEGGSSGVGSASTLAGVGVAAGDAGTVYVNARPIWLPCDCSSSNGASCSDSGGGSSSGGSSGSSSTSSSANGIAANSNADGHARVRVMGWEFVGSDGVRAASRFSSTLNFIAARACLAYLQPPQGDGENDADAVSDALSCLSELDDA